MLPPPGGIASVKILQNGSLEFVCSAADRPVCAVNITVAILTLLNLAPKVPFLEDLKKKFPKVTGIKDILCMLSKYIIMHGFRSPLGQKMP